MLVAQEPSLNSFLVPKEPPEEMPARLRADFEKGLNGDVFAMIKANNWAPGLPTRYVFPRALIMQKLEILVKRDDPRAMRELAHELNANWQQYTLANADPKCKEDELRSQALIERAANLGDPGAMVEFAHHLWGKDHKSKEAVQWLLKYREIQEAKAKTGDLDAMYALGAFGFPTDCAIEMNIRRKFSEEGLQWERKAAELGHTTAAYQLGLDLQGRNTREAVQWIERAANQGHWMAMVQMGKFYAFGFWNEVGQAVVNPEKRPDLVPKCNPAKAWEWWDKAIALVGEESVMEMVNPSGETELPLRPEK